MQGRGIQRLMSGYMVAVGIAVLAASLPGCGDDADGIAMLAAGLPGGDDADSIPELMARWNQVPQTNETVDRFTFEWPAVDQFPHPTYKGGSARAYRRFAAILVAFYETGDNFDFLARNSFFTFRLKNVFPSGQVGLDTTFQELTEQLSDASLTNIPNETRQKLAMFAMRMR